MLRCADASRRKPCPNEATCNYAGETLCGECMSDRLDALRAWGDAPDESDPAIVDLRDAPRDLSPRERR